MPVSWTDWKTFPDLHTGLRLDAPDGPGVFEVRHIATGDQIAFAVSANVAATRETLIQPQASGLRAYIQRRKASGWA